VTAVLVAQAILGSHIERRYPYMRLETGDEEEARHMAHGTYNAAYFYLACAALSIYFWIKGYRAKSAALAAASRPQTLAALS
jgi:hypothetical protein